MGRGENGSSHKPCLVDTLGDVRLVEGELVGGELKGRKVSFESLTGVEQRPTAKRDV